jgi:hypothetical protein
LFNALQHLKHNKNEILIFHVFDKNTELDFDFGNRPVEFIDLETGEKLKLEPDDIRDSFRQKAIERALEVKLRCAQFKIDYVRADINEGVEKVLEAYLVKRSKMR